MAQTTIGGIPDTLAKFTDDTLLETEADEGGGPQGFKATAYQMGEYTLPYQPRRLIASSQDLNATFFGWNVVNNTASPVVLTVPLNVEINLERSQFEVIRNAPGDYSIQAVAGVTINGVDGALFVLNQQYDRAVFTQMSINNWTAIEYSQSTGTSTLQDAYDNGNGEIDLSPGKPLKLTSTQAIHAGFVLSVMTDPEFKLIPSPDKGLHAWSSSSDRIIVNKATPGAPVYDELAYVSDIPVGVAPAYGEMFFNGNATETIIASQGTPVKIAATYSSGLLSNFTQSLGTLTKTGTTEVCKITAVVSGTFDLIASRVTISIFRNGVLIGKSKQPEFFGTTSPASHNVCCHALETLADTDFIEVFIQNDDGTDNPTITDFNVIIEELAGGSGSITTQTLQEVWNESPNGFINLAIASSKPFAVNQFNGNKILYVDSSGVEIEATHNSPARLTTYTSNYVQLKMEDVRAGISGVSGEILFAANVDVVGPPVEYDLYRMTVTSNNKLPLLQTSSLKFTTNYHDTTKTTLNLNGVDETIELGDTLVPLSLSSGQIASRQKVDSMLYWNSTDKRQQYHDETAAKERVIATLDDISTTVVESGNSGVTISSTTGFQVFPAPSIASQFYTRIGNIVTYSIYFINMQKAAAAPDTYIELNLPFSPSFTTSTQVNGTGIIGSSTVSIPADTSRLSQIAGIPSHKVRVTYFIEVEVLRIYDGHLQITYEIQ